MCDNLQDCGRLSVGSVHVYWSASMAEAFHVADKGPYQYGFEAFARVSVRDNERRGRIWPLFSERNDDGTVPEMGLPQPLGHLG